MKKATKSTSRNVAAKKVAAKKVTAKKVTAKKVTAKKVTAKKVAARRSTATMSARGPSVRSMNARNAAGVAAAAAPPTIVVKPTAEFQNDSLARKFSKLKLVRNGGFAKAIELGVAIQGPRPQVRVDVTKTEVGDVSVRDPAFLALQLTVQVVEVVGAAVESGFEIQAATLAVTVANLGRVHGVWEIQP